LKFERTILFLLPIAVLSGCASARMVTIGSEPPGATVMADGKAIGDTPVTIHPDDVFPPRWIGSSYLVKGTLALEKNGCKRVSMPVDDRILSGDIQVSLQCTPATMNDAPHSAQDAVPGAPIDAMPAEPQAVGSGAAGAHSVEKRLMELKRLHDKGLITDPEYTQQRKRILNSL
jgi:hypothetical protein